MVRLNFAAGFGYVRDAAGQQTYMFIVERALKHSAMRALSLGKSVRFRVSDNGRVDELVAS